MNVFLIGDSIRLNSEKHVKDALKPDIQILSPIVNCESSNKVKRHIESWLNSEKYDLIHINCGLHDVRYDPGKDRPVSTIKEYSENLKSIFGELLKLQTDIIWATSTPINEKIHNESKVSRRYLTDIIDYNRASVELANEFGFKINDLFSELSNLNLDKLLLPDGIHFNKKGNLKIGHLVAKAINGSTNI